MMKWLAMSALLCGCATGKVIVVDGVEIYEKVWVRSSSELQRRAMAELNCPEISLTLVRKEYREPVEVLAIGCGRRAMYVRPMAYAGNYRAMGSWQLTTITNDTASPPPASPAPVTGAPSSI